MKSHLIKCFTEILLTRKRTDNHKFYFYVTRSNDNLKLDVSKALGLQQ